MTGARARHMNGIYTVLADPSVLPEGMANDKKKGILKCTN